MKCYNQYHRMNLPMKTILYKNKSLAALIFIFSYRGTLLMLHCKMFLVQQKNIKIFMKYKIARIIYEI